ncbi:MAG: hypothetical protein ACJ72E_08915 [Marmoricola sp.]
MSEELTPAERAERRRRLAEVFGDVLPEQTRDDKSGDDGDLTASEEWLKRQVPPHHG